jgi:hypothetical protein
MRLFKGEGGAGASGQGAHRGLIPLDPADLKDLLKGDDAELGVFDALLEKAHPGLRQSAHETLDRGEPAPLLEMLRAVPAPSGRTAELFEALGLTLLRLGAVTWETRNYSAGLARGIDALRDAYRAAVADRGVEADPCVVPIVHSLDQLQHAVRVENAMNSCNYEHMKQLARAILKIAERGLAGRGSYAGPMTPETIEQWVHKAFDGYALYYRAVDRITTLLTENSYAALGASAIETVIADVTPLAKRLEEMRDLFATELRTHIDSLKALAVILADPGHQSGVLKLWYVYPFAFLEERNPVQEGLDNLDALLKDWGAKIAARLELLEFERIDEHAATSVWSRSDRGEILRSPAEGAVVRFKPIRVAGEEPLLEVRVVFLACGLHRIEFSLDLEDLDPSQLYRRLRRVSPDAGDVELVLEGSGQARKEGRLCEFAQEIIEVMTAIATSPVEFDAASDGRIVLSVRSPVQIAEAAVSSWEPFANSPIGRVALSPVRQAASAIEEWTRLDLPTPRIGPYGALSRDERLATTTNTIVLFTPQSPNFIALQFEDLALFSASVAPWLRAQSRRLSGLELDANELIGRIQQDFGDADDAEISVKRLALFDLSTTVRAHIDWIRSPRLVSNPVLRELLEFLFGAGSVSAFEKEAADRVRAIEKLTNALADISQTIDRKRRSHEEDRLHFAQFILAALLAVISVAAIDDIFELFAKLAGPDLTALEKAITWGAIGVALFAIVWTGLMLARRALSRKR